MITQAVSFDKNDYVISTHHALQEAIKEGNINKEEAKKYIASIKDKDIDVSKYTVSKRIKLSGCLLDFKDVVRGFAGGFCGGLFGSKNDF